MEYTETEKSNLYWATYRNLENEFLRVAEYISIDDAQLTVYSSKTADLLVRISIEIESLSKHLFFKTGGTVPNDKSYAYFDTDCIKHLGRLWQIEKKKVALSCPYVYVSDKHRILTPLKDCSKQNHGRWKIAYQAVKHDRTNSLNRATVHALMEALGALFLLNVYNRDITFDLGVESNGSKFDTSLGSLVFSIEVHPFLGINDSGIYEKNQSFDRCSYLIRATSSSAAVVCKVFRSLNEHLKEAIKEHLMSLAKSGKSIQASDVEEAKRQLMMPTARAHAREINVATSGMRYEAILNKGQDLDVIL